jgi:AcrR family transcriptional regulator
MKHGMPARDEGERERRREQIMDGALRVFASKGFDRATNQDIAKAAGIRSPGLIYHYFTGGKVELFQQMLGHFAPVLDLFNHPEPLMDRPPAETLSLVAGALLKMTENRLAIAALKVMVGEATRRPAVASMINLAGPQRALGFLTRYLSHQMELGAIRRMEAGIAARCFMGPIVLYLLTREVFVQPDAATLAPETMVAHAVEVFLRGMAPDAVAPDAVAPDAVAPATM